MSVSKSGNGTYEVQVWFRDWQGARRKKHRRGFRTKAEARAWEREFLLRQSGAPDMLFEDFCKVYEADRAAHIRRSTLLMKENVIRTKLVPTFGKMRLTEITAARVLAWQSELRASRNPRTGRRYTDTYLRTINTQLSSILNHAVRFYGLPSNPMRQTGKIGSEHAGEMLFWTKDEYLRFSEAIADKPLSHLAFEILYWCGIREGELLALTPSDFDLAKGELSITKSYQRIRGEDVITPPKTAKSRRVIAVPDFLCAELEEYLSLFGVPRDERIFQVTKSYLYHEVRRGCAASGVKVIRVHDLRHSHVSLLVELGFNVLAIADRMGHESTDITFRYAHLLPNTQGRMAEALSAERGDTRV